MAVQPRHCPARDVLAWHRQGFQLYWLWKSRRRLAGRPPCCLCNTPILALENRTSINDAHYHPHCFDRQAAKNDKDPVAGRKILGAGRDVRSPE